MGRPKHEQSQSERAVRGDGVSYLLLGARLALTGGRDGWLRTLMTALGVGLGVTLLLGAASIPTMIDGRSDRLAARSDNRFDDPAAGATAVLVMSVDTVYREVPVRGRLLWAEGPGAPTPPGVSRLPGDGEMLISPALASLLASPDGALLRPRMPYNVIGTIGEAGLSGPGELAYYAGDARLNGDNAARLDRFGSTSPPEPTHPMLVLLAVIGFVVLLLPVAVFVGAAIRFGGDQRDQRLAALRLMGTDRGMTTRVAIGDTLVGTALGIGIGVLVFLAGRQLAPLVTLWDLSLFTSDIRPDPVLAAIVVAAVPALAIAVTLLALRRITVEPLGVVRRVATVRRRLWWRAALPVAGLVLLYPMIGELARGGGSFSRPLVALGAVLFLVGVTALLPWLVDATVRRLRGGSVSWQLAIRRLQLDAGGASRPVSGVAVAVAGAIALQTFFIGVQGNFTRDTGADRRRADVEVRLTADRTRPDSTSGTPLASTQGVRWAAAVRRANVSWKPANAEQPTYASLFIGDCAALAELATLPGCADGDVFLVEPETGQSKESLNLPAPGQRFDDPQWTIPATARTVPGRRDPSGMPHDGILATPAAVAGARTPTIFTTVYLRLDPADPDAIERVRNAAAALDPQALAFWLSSRTEDRRFVSIRRGLFVGVVVTLALIAASLLVGILEQLRERRRLLAMLVAVGTRRRTLCWSVLWQTAVPMLLALALAALAGTALGAVLLRTIGNPISLDWRGVTAFSAAGAAAILLVTVLSLPVLWRLMRPDALRTE
jgi:hypothetical protein